MEDQNLSFVPKPRQQNPLLKRKPLNLGTTFVNYKSPQQPIQIQDILHQYQMLLLLFGAEWCNISKPFFKELKAFYDEVNLQTKKMEIIYIPLEKKFTLNRSHQMPQKQKNNSNSNNASIYNQLYRDFPWLGIKQQDSRIKDLKQFYNVTGIPNLILLDSAGQQIMVRCRNDVYNMGQDQAFEKWLKLKKEQDQATKRIQDLKQ